MLKKLSIVVIAIVLLVFCSATVGSMPPPALADEETPTPGITGFWGEVDFPAKNDDGIKITDVEVRFTSGQGKRYAVHVHEDGTYAIVGLPSGQYTVELWPEGFVVSYEPPYAAATSLSESARLKTGQNVRLDLGYLTAEIEHPIPTPTPTPTPFPISESGLYPPSYVAAGMEIRKFMEMDTDDDGEKEVVLINGLPDAPGSQVMVLDSEGGDVWVYYIIGDSKGVKADMETVDRIERHDFDRAKPNEVVTYGTGGGNYYFFIHRWGEGDYNLLAGYKGPGRFVLEDIDDDGPDEMLYVEPDEEMDGKSSFVYVYRWTGEEYAYNKEKYHCPTFLKDVVELYYQAINARDYEEAYSYWGAEMQARQSYQDFEAGFATTVEATIIERKVVEDAPDSRVEQVIIEATDKKGEETVTSRFSITWTLGFEGGCPRLLEAEVEKIK